MRNKNRWPTIEQLRASPIWEMNKHKFELTPEEKKKAKKEKKDREPLSREKAWINEQLMEFTEVRCLKLKREYKFHYARAWRFDWAIPALKIAIEYEGIFSEKSRHTTHSGFTGDTDKYNDAQGLGWTVYRYTAMNYESLTSDLQSH